MIAFEYIYNRRVPLIYQSPAICEFDFSGTGEPSIYLAPILRVGAPSGLVFGGVGGFTLSWGVIPGALCYSVYRSIDENNPYGEYQLVAECLDQNYYVVPDDDDHFWRIEAITLDGVSDLSDPIKAPGTHPVPVPPPPPPVPPPGTCPQTGEPLPDTWRIPTHDVLGSHRFTTKANSELEVTIPPGMSGVYQFRYRNGAQGATCDFSPPDYEFYGMGFGEWTVFVNGVPKTSSWDTDEWTAYTTPHSGWSASGQVVIRRLSSPPWMFWESTLDGDIDDSNVEAEFHNGSHDPDYQQFCFESPGKVSAGTTVKLGFYQEWYTTCVTKPHMVVKSDGPWFDLIRVARYPDSPTQVTVLDYPGVGSFVLTTYSQSDFLWEFAGTVPGIGWALLRGDCTVGKWRLWIPWPSGGWTGEKLYGTTPIGYFQRTSPAGDGIPDCLGVV